MASARTRPSSALSSPALCSCRPRPQCRLPHTQRLRRRSTVAACRRLAGRRMHAPGGGTLTACGSSTATQRATTCCTPLLRFVGQPSSSLLTSSRPSRGCWAPSTGCTRTAAATCASAAPRRRCGMSTPTKGCRGAAGGCTSRTGAWSCTILRTRRPRWARRSCCQAHSSTAATAIELTTRAGTSRASVSSWPAGRPASTPSPGQPARWW
mmetsp:Transcript_31827/g.105351  ORF Transcript_31827/g.105351 Transcript_31827/m.105351 type:complete len:210 (-) Transcript_31827:466-1095(-)